MKQPVSITLERQITRADGSVEPREVVAFYHRNPLKRALARLRGVKGKVTPNAGSRTSS